MQCILPDVNKPWTVKFNAPVLSADVIGTSLSGIYIADENNNRLPVSPTLSVDGKAVTVTPNNPYTKGVEYRLYITDQIHDINGNKNRRAIVMPFKVNVKADELKNLVEINDGGAIEKTGEDIILTRPQSNSIISNKQLMQPDQLRASAVAAPLIPDFNYNIRYIARVLPVEVDGITVQANDLVIDQDRAFVAYNARGEV